MSYYEKYLKYKNKYLELKYNFQQKGGATINDNVYQKYTNEYLGIITAHGPGLYYIQPPKGEKFILLQSDQNKSWYVKNPGEIDVSRYPEPGIDLPGDVLPETLRRNQQRPDTERRKSEGFMINHTTPPMLRDDKTGEIYVKQYAYKPYYVTPIKGDNPIRFIDGEVSTFHKTYLYMKNLLEDGKTIDFEELINGWSGGFMMKFIKFNGLIYLLEPGQIKGIYLVKLEQIHKSEGLTLPRMEDLVSLTEKFFQNKHQEEELNASRDFEKLLRASEGYMIENPHVLPVLRLDSQSMIEEATQYKPAPVPTIEEMFIPYHASDTGKHLFGRKPDGSLYTNPAPAAAPIIKLEMVNPYHASDTGKHLFGRRPDGSLYTNPIIFYDNKI